MDFMRHAKLRSTALSKRITRPARRAKKEPLLRAFFRPLLAALTIKGTPMRYSEVFVPGALPRHIYNPRPTWKLEGRF
jgi:hypothetical protein